MIRKFLLTGLVFITIVAAGCKDDADISATIVGKWSGSDADFKINPSGIIPAFSLAEEELPVELNFSKEGKLTLMDNKGVTTSGSYVLSGDQLTIDIDYTFELIDLAGVYTVRELTNSDLSAEIEKDGSYTHPDTGQQFDGKVIATLNFTRAGN